MIDVYYQTAQLPSRIRAMSVEMPDGSYTVLVNDGLSQMERIESARHEREHIEGGDFERYDADQIERSAHGMED